VLDSIDFLMENSAKESRALRKQLRKTTENNFLLKIDRLGGSFGGGVDGSDDIGGTVELRCLSTCFVAAQTVIEKVLGGGGARTFQRCAVNMVRAGKGIKATNATAERPETDPTDAVTIATPVVTPADAARAARMVGVQWVQIDEKKFARVEVKGITLLRLVTADDELETIVEGEDGDGDEGGEGGKKRDLAGLFRAAGRMVGRQAIAVRRGGMEGVGGGVCVCVSVCVSVSVSLYLCLCLCVCELKVKVRRDEWGANSHVVDEHILSNPDYVNVPPSLASLYFLASCSTTPSSSSPSAPSLFLRRYGE
jgi:hypothetical protein